MSVLASSATGSAKRLARTRFAKNQASSTVAFDGPVLRPIETPVACRHSKRSQSRPRTPRPRSAMGPLKIVRYIWKHPMNRGARVAAVGRFVRWQIGTRVLGLPCLIPMGEHGVMVASRGDHGATGNFYCGLHEYPDMLFVLHALEPGDLFLDAGANVGSYTVLAGAVAGADVICCEPVPTTVEKLRRNVAANLMSDRVQTCHTAVGRAPGTCRMTTGHDAMNRVLDEGSDASVGEPSVEVPISRIDDLVPPGRVRVMKLDVEGFEREALAGARRLLGESSLLAVLIELNGAGRRYGVEDAELDATLRAAGFSPATYNPTSRKLSELATFNSSGNTLYVREAHELRDRLEHARPVQVFGRTL